MYGIYYIISRIKPVLEGEDRGETIFDDLGVKMKNLTQTEIFSSPFFLILFTPNVIYFSLKTIIYQNLDNKTLIKSQKYLRQFFSIWEGEEGYY